MNKVSVFIIFLLIQFFLVSAFSQVSRKQFHFYEDFNLGVFRQGWRNKEITKNNNFEIDTISKSGRLNDGYLISVMNSTSEEGKAKRAEFGVILHDSINSSKFFSFSFKIPDTFKLDKKNLGSEIMICQWHSKPAPHKGWDHYIKYNEFNRPSIALYITTNDNLNYHLLLRYGNNGKQQFEHKGEVWSTVALKEIEINKWYDMVFEIKWSFTNFGYVASWINNEPFTPFNGLHNKIYGANMHNASPAYFKFGQYRYWDDTNKHEIYFDELRVGDSFKEVSLYKEPPLMFLEMEDLKFIRNQK